MTHMKKIACRLRWFLLVIWVLCFACSLLFLFGIIFDEAGLDGTPAIAILGPFFKLFDNADKYGYAVFVFIYLALFLMTQWLFLRQRGGWKIRIDTVGRPMKWAAVAAAFVITLLSVGILYSILDLFSGKVFDGEEYLSHKISGVLRYMFLLTPLALWSFWSVIFIIYWRQSDHYTWVGRVIRGLIGGSVLELFVAVPIYVTRQDECYCARGSYTGLVFGATALMWAFGPGVFFLFIKEKKRRERLLEFEKDKEIV